MPKESVSSSSDAESKTFTSHILIVHQYLPEFGKVDRMESWGRFDQQVPFVVL